jgi:hypothetical protein
VLKSELVRALKEKLPELQVKDVELALNCILRQLADAIVQGERIEIRGFGSFNLHHGGVSPNRRKFRRIFCRRYSPIIPAPIWPQLHQGLCSAHYL